jgi:hypothetical protein
VNLIENPVNTNTSGVLRTIASEECVNVPTLMALSLQFSFDCRDPAEICRLDAFKPIDDSPACMRSKRVESKFKCEWQPQRLEHAHPEIIKWAPCACILEIWDLTLNVLVTEKKDKKFCLIFHRRYVCSRHQYSMHEIMGHVVYVAVSDAPSV